MTLLILLVDLELPFSLAGAARSDWDLSRPAWLLFSSTGSSLNFICYAQRTIMCVHREIFLWEQLLLCTSFNWPVMMMTTTVRKYCLLSVNTIMYYKYLAKKCFYCSCCTILVTWVTLWKMFENLSGETPKRYDQWTTKWNII